MVVYLDIVFLLNGAADAAALYATGRLSGLTVAGKRLASAAALVRLAFGRREGFLRRVLLFFLLSCSLAGALVAGERLLRERGGALEGLDWRIFFLAGGGCFLLLSVVFRGGARHSAAGQLCRCRILRRGREAELTALLDTGCTLTDGLSGAPVLTVHWAALEALWTPEERAVLSRLEADGASRCLEKLGGGFRLLPYRAVGVRSGLLLCFKADGAELDGQSLGAVTVALSPTPVSDGGGYAALWGGDAGKEAESYAA